ncbi:MAG: CHAT domain-containing protein [Nitrosomonas sp.]
MDDNGAQVLMSIFYQQLKQSNKTTKTEASQIAQKTLIDGKVKKISESSEHQRGKSLQSPGVTNRLSHPYYWAPFILIGNGS